VNLILFEAGELDRPLPLSDPRAVHLLTVLRRGPGESFDAGLVDGPRGRAEVREQTPEGLSLEFVPGEAPPPLYPVILAVGAGRPQTVRKILRETTALGVSEIHFFASGKGEKAYLNSSIYREEQYRPCLIEGAQQAFCTRLPRVEVHGSLGEALRRLTRERGSRLCLDNYEAALPLTRYFRSGAEGEREPRYAGDPVILWIGSERGWSDKERGLFREAEIPLAGLGSRVLRTETACTAAVTVCLAGMGFLD